MITVLFYICLFGGFFFVLLLLMPKHQTHASRHYLYQHTKCPPSVWLSFLFSPRNTGRPNSFSLHIHTHGHSHTVIHSVFSLFFALSSFIAISLTLPVQTVCVGDTVLWWTHFRHSCVSQDCFFFQWTYRRGLSMCLSICATYLICIFPPLSTHPRVIIFFSSFSLYLFCILIFVCVSPSLSLYCLQFTMCNTTDLPILL